VSYRPLRIPVSLSAASLATLATLTVLATLALAAPALAAPEEPITEPATGVSATEATLNGELNPGGSASTGYFFTYNNNGTCSEGPSSELQPEQTGEHLKVSAPVTGLEPSREYTFCVVATHQEGETLEQTSGGPRSFTTAAAPPAVDFQSFFGVTPFEAHLDAFVNPNNQSTNCEFQYGTTASYGTNVPCEPSTLEGFGDQFLTGSLTGLEPATTYHFHVVAENASKEKTEGADEQLTTPALEPPIIGAESTTAITPSSATLHAQVNPNYQETTYSFQYATNEALAGATTVEGESALPAEFAELPASVKTGTLLPRTTYYYRVLASNASGTAEGPVEHFTTTATPIATTAPAETITRTTAVLSGTVNPGGEPTTYHFAYATAADYQPGAANPYVKGGTTPESPNIGSDYTAHPANPTTAIELTPGTTYHYALVATNALGSVIGPDVTFTTAPPTPPLVSTGEATGVSQTSATLTGSVDTRELSTTTQFEFGTTPGAGTLLPATVTAASGSTVTVSASFAGDLQPGTTYYYRVIATNVDGTGSGQERSFTTGAFPGTGPAAAALVAWPGFVLQGLAAGPPHEPISTGPRRLTKKQKLAKAPKACNKKPKKKRAACRRAAKRRHR
jgi:hypothetical protein